MLSFRLASSPNSLEVATLQEEICSLPAPLLRPKNRIRLIGLLQLILNTRNGLFGREILPTRNGENCFSFV